MEGQEEQDHFDLFNLFNQCQFENVGDLLSAFPFNNTFEQEEENFNFFIFPGVENYDHLENFHNQQQQIMQGGQLLEKISKCEENYNNILQNNIMASPTENVNDKISETFESNLTLAEGTLPGLLISIMHKENCPLPESVLLNQIFPKFEDLRKVNGSKYSGDIHKVLRSTLSSSGIFFRTVDGKHYFKEKEALDYIIKVTEKVLTKKLEKEKKDSKSSSTKSTVKKNKKKTQSFSAQMNYKICKVYNILDKMLSRCRGSVEEKLNNSFQNANGSIELLQKIGGQNKLVGILMCFKYFKSIMNKYFKLSQKKKKLESLIDLNKLNEKLDTLSKKMELLEKSQPLKSSSLSFKSSSDTNFAVHSQSSYSPSFSYSPWHSNMDL